MPIKNNHFHPYYPDKILVVAPSWLGDMLMSQTLLKLLKQQRPDAAIHVLAPAFLRDILRRMPEVDEVWVSPFAHGELQLRRRYQLAQQLRAEFYTQAIVLPQS